MEVPANTGWPVAYNGHETHTGTIILQLFWILSGTTRVRRYQKGKNEEGKTNLDLLAQETVSGIGICWAICKYASQTDNHANIHHSVFTGRMPFLPPSQQCQSTEGTCVFITS